MTGQVKANGAWRTATGLSVKVGGQWKTVTSSFIKVGGQWKQWFASKITDAFTRNSTSSGLGTSDTGQPWNSLRGNWRIGGSNNAISDDAGSTYALAAINFGNTDATVSTSVSSAGTGPAFWVTDSGSWWASYVHSYSTQYQYTYSCNCSNYSYGPYCSGQCYNTTPATGGSCNTCSGGNTGGSRQDRIITQEPKCSMCTGGCVGAGPVQGWDWSCQNGQLVQTFYDNPVYTGFVYCSDYYTHYIACTGASYTPAYPDCTCGVASYPSGGGTTYYTPSVASGCSCAGASGGSSSLQPGGSGTTCQQCQGTGTNNYWLLRLIKSEGGTISSATGDISLSSAAAAIQVVTLGNQINVKAYSDVAKTSQLGSDLNHTASSPTKGTSVGIIKAPVDANQGSTVDDFSATI